MSIAALSTCGGSGPGEDSWQSLARLAGTACLKPILATAVVVGDDLLLTVAHAIAGSEDLTVVDLAGTERSPVVIAFDDQRDLALLEVEGFDRAAVFASPDEGGTGTITAVGSDLTVDANPYRIVRMVTASSGDIYDQGQVLRQVIEIEADVRPGDSGAPLINDEQEMIGMVFAESQGIDGSAWALHVSEIEAFLLLPRSGEEVERGRCR